MAFHIARHGKHASARRPSGPYPDYHIQVLDRVFRILDALSDDRSEAGVSELAGRLRLHRSTTHRLLMVLERNRYVERSQPTGRYRLGSKLFELGTRVLARIDLGDTARPFLERLVTETGETAHLGVLRQGEVVSLFNVQSTRNLRAPATVGRRIPAYCTSLGKALLAFLPERELEALVKTLPLKPYTPKTLARPSLFRAELKRVRKRGYAIDDEEFEEGLRCIGAPIRDHSGRVIAALSIAGPVSRLKDSRMSALSHSVARASTDMSRKLGYREPNHEEKSEP